MDRLEELESNSIYIIREAHKTMGKLALLWSMGKDSTTLLWLARKAFFAETGGELPIPVLHIDTGYKFPEMYGFREKYAEEWKLDLVIARNEKAIAEGTGPVDKLKCCTALKTEALRQALEAHGFDGLLLGIRRDEHGIRAKERTFSPRDGDFRWDYENQPPELWDYYSRTPPRGGESAEDREEGTHMRVHPLLDWTESDVWAYVEREGIPVVDLYLAREGRRYRSIGCLTCCVPVESQASTVGEILEEVRTSKEGERAGRAQDKESHDAMQKLRALGYM